MSKEIYKKAIEKWGEKSQLEMAQEEATELALAVRKFNRNPNDKTFNDLASEMADVEIMNEQIIYMFPEIVEQIKIQKKYKLDRLSKSIDDGIF